MKSVIKTGNSEWDLLPPRVGSTDADDVKFRLVRYRNAIPELERKLDECVKKNKLLKKFVSPPPKSYD